MLMASTSNNKYDKTKLKFKTVEINKTFKGNSLETQKPASIRGHHGMQSLGKVTTRRMPPPAHLPSLKSEHGTSDSAINLMSSGWAAGSKEDEKINNLNSEIQTTKTSTIDHSEMSSSSGQLWSNITMGTRIGRNREVHFNDDFPMLRDDKFKTSTASTSGSDVLYGPGPSLRPQNVSSWREGGGRRHSDGGLNEISEGDYEESHHPVSPLRRQLSEDTGGDNKAMFHGNSRFMGPRMNFGGYPPMSRMMFPPHMMPPNPHYMYQQRSGYPPNSMYPPNFIPSRPGFIPNDIRMRPRLGYGEGIRMPRDSEGGGGEWATSNHVELDYNEKLVFSDEESEEFSKTKYNSSGRKWSNSETEFNSDPRSSRKRNIHMEGSGDIELRRQTSLTDNRKEGGETWRNNESYYHSRSGQRHELERSSSDGFEHKREYNRNYSREDSYEEEEPYRQAPSDKTIKKLLPDYRYSQENYQSENYSREKFLSDKNPYPRYEQPTKNSWKYFEEGHHESEFGGLQGDSIEKRNTFRSSSWGDELVEEEETAVVDPPRTMLSNYDSVARSDRKNDNYDGIYDDINNVSFHDSKNFNSRKTEDSKSSFPPPIPLQTTRQSAPTVQSKFTSLSKKNKNLMQPNTKDLNSIQETSTLSTEPIWGTEPTAINTNEKDSMTENHNKINQSMTKPVDNVWSKEKQNILENNRNDDSLKNRDDSKWQNSRESGKNGNDGGYHNYFNKEERLSKDNSGINDTNKALSKDEISHTIRENSGNQKYKNEKPLRDSVYNQDDENKEHNILKDDLNNAKMEVRFEEERPPAAKRPKDSGYSSKSRGGYRGRGSDRYESDSKYKNSKIKPTSVKMEKTEIKKDEREKLELGNKNEIRDKLDESEEAKQERNYWEKRKQEMMNLSSQVKESIEKSEPLDQNRSSRREAAGKTSYYRRKVQPLLSDKKPTPLMEIDLEMVRLRNEQRNKEVMLSNLEVVDIKSESRQEIRPEGNKYNSQRSYEGDTDDSRRLRKDYAFDNYNRRSRGKRGQRSRANENGRKKSGEEINGENTISKSYSRRGRSDGYRRSHFYSKNQANLNESSTNQLNKTEQVHNDEHANNEEWETASESSDVLTSTNGENKESEIPLEDKTTFSNKDHRLEKGKDKTSKSDSSKSSKLKNKDAKDVSKVKLNEREKRDMLANIDVNNYAGVVVVDTHPDVSMNTLDINTHADANDGFQEVQSRRALKNKNKAAQMVQECGKSIPESGADNIQRNGDSKKVDKDYIKSVPKLMSVTDLVPPPIITNSKKLGPQHLPPRMTKPKSQSDNGRRPSSRSTSLIPGGMTFWGGVEDSGTDPTVLSAIENWDNTMASTIPPPITSKTSQQQPTIEYFKVSDEPISIFTSFSLSSVESWGKDTIIPSMTILPSSAASHLIASNDSHLISSASASQQPWEVSTIVSVATKNDKEINGGFHYGPKLDEGGINLDFSFDAGRGVLSSVMGQVASGAMSQSVSVSLRDVVLTDVTQTTPSHINNAGYSNLQGPVNYNGITHGNSSYGNIPVATNSNYNQISTNSNFTSVSNSYSSQVTNNSYIPSSNIQGGASIASYGNIKGQCANANYSNIVTTNSFMGLQGTSSNSNYNNATTSKTDYNSNSNYITTSHTNYNALQDASSNNTFNTVTNPGYSTIQDTLSNLQGTVSNSTYRNLQTVNVNYNPVVSNIEQQRSTTSASMNHSQNAARITMETEMAQLSLGGIDQNEADDIPSTEEQWLKLSKVRGVWDCKQTDYSAPDRTGRNSMVSASLENSSSGMPTNQYATASIITMTTNQHINPYDQSYNKNNQSVYLSENSNVCKVKPQMQPANSSNLYAGGVNLTMPPQGATPLMIHIGQGSMAHHYAPYNQLIAQDCALGLQPYGHPSAQGSFGFNLSQQPIGQGQQQSVTTPQPVLATPGTPAMAPALALASCSQANLFFGGPSAASNDLYGYRNLFGLAAGGQAAPQATPVQQPSTIMVSSTTSSLMSTAIKAQQYINAGSANAIPYSQLFGNTNQTSSQFCLQYENPFNLSQPFNIQQTLQALSLQQAEAQNNNSQIIGSHLLPQRNSLHGLQSNTFYAQLQQPYQQSQQQQRTSNNLQATSMKHYQIAPFGLQQSTQQANYGLQQTSQSAGINYGIQQHGSAFTTTYQPVNSQLKHSAPPFKPASQLMQSPDSNDQYSNQVLSENNGNMDNGNNSSMYTSNSKQSNQFQLFTTTTTSQPIKGTSGNVTPANLQQNLYQHRPTTVPGTFNNSGNQNITSIKQQIVDPRNAWPENPKDFIKLNQLAENQAKKLETVSSKPALIVQNTISESLTTATTSFSSLTKTTSISVTGNSSVTTISKAAVVSVATVAKLTGKEDPPKNNINLLKPFQKNEPTKERPSYIQKQGMAMPPHSYHSRPVTPLLPPAQLGLVAGSMSNIHAQERKRALLEVQSFLNPDKKPPPKLTVKEGAEK